MTTHERKKALLPCVFCSSKPYHLRCDGVHVYVRCPNTQCDARGPIAKTDEEAIAAWNRRALLSEAQTDGREAIIKKLRDLNACDPECEGRCVACPNEVAREAADYLAALAKLLPRG